MAEPIIVSYSEIDTLRQCLHKHDLAYRQRWTGGHTSEALARGTDWHFILETHYRILQQIQREERDGVPSLSNAATAERIWQAVHPLLYSELSGQQTERQELLEWMYRGYIERYGLDPEWDILAVEHSPVMWLPTPSGRRSRFGIKMKIDLVVRDRTNGNVYVTDHKTCKDLPKDKDFDLDDQFGLYTWGLRQMKHEVFGAIHNACRTLKYKDASKPQPLDERFKRTRLVRTDRELETIAHEAYAAVRNAYGFAPGTAPRSPNPDTCKWKCDYTDACLLGRKGVDERGVLLDMGMIQNFERH